MKDIPVPILMAHGERSDHLTRCDKMVFREVENPDKKLNLYPTLSTTNKSGKRCWWLRGMDEQDPSGNGCEKL